MNKNSNVHYGDVTTYRRTAYQMLSVYQQRTQDDGICFVIYRLVYSLLINQQARRK